MRVRAITRIKKVVETDTQWKGTDVPPRHYPIISRAKPIRAGWEWRSVRAKSPDGRNFIAYLEVNLRKGDFKSVLIEDTVNGPSVVARYEYHASHPGIHVHAHCERSGMEIGATGMDKLARAPSLKKHHRRVGALSPSTFWAAASRFYGMEYETGPLFA